MDRKAADRRMVSRAASFTHRRFWVWLAGALSLSSSFPLCSDLGLIRKSSGLVVRAVSHNLGENDRMQNISPFRWGFTASDRKVAY